MEVNFKFEIGQIVTTRVAIAETVSAAKIGEGRHPHLYMVVSRFLDECPGGVQLHYGLARAGECKRFNEPEVALPSEIDMVAMMGSCRKIVSDIATEQRALERAERKAEREEERREYKERAEK